MFARTKACGKAQRDGRLPRGPSDGDANTAAVAPTATCSEASAPCGKGKNTGDEQQVVATGSSTDSVAHPDLKPLIAVFQSVQESLSSIRAATAQKVESDQTILNQAETLRLMSNRLRQYEEDYVAEHILKPILRDVIMLYDAILKARQRLTSGPAQDIAELLGSLHVDVLECLARHGVSLITGTERQLNPKLQKVVGVKEAECPRSGEVVAEVRPGFCLDSTVLRHQEVIVVQVKKQEDAS